MARQRRHRTLTSKAAHPVGGRPGRRAEARLWTGPVAHLVGGTLDVLGALGRYGLTRVRALLKARGRR